MSQHPTAPPPPPAVPPRSLHVESTAGALLPVGEKASFQPALDGVAASLLADESILWLARVHRDTPGIGGRQCLAVVTTHRFAVLPEKEEDGPVVRFHGLHEELQLRVLKRGRLLGSVEVAANGVSAELGVSPAQVELLQDLLTGVAQRNPSLLRPDASAYDPAAGPWWEQLAEDYGYEWQNTNYVIEPGGTRRQSAPLRIDRTGIRFGSENRPDRHVPWAEVTDIGTAGVKPGLFRQARSGGEGLVGSFAGGIDPSEGGQMAVFVVRTRELEAHVNVTTFSPTPLGRLLGTLDAFVEAHAAGALAGPAGPAPEPAPVVAPHPPVPSHPQPQPPPVAEPPRPPVQPAQPAPAPEPGPPLSLSTVVLPTTQPPVATPAASEPPPQPPVATPATSGPPPQPPVAPSPEPASGPADGSAARLAQVREQLKMIEALHAEGLLTDEEMAAKRAEILARI